MNRDAHVAAYFTDRCGASIEVERDTFAPCGLKHGHEGPHEPVKLDKQTTDESPAARSRGRKARSESDAAIVRAAYERRKEAATLRDEAQRLDADADRLEALVDEKARRG